MRVFNIAKWTVNLKAAWCHFLALMSRHDFVSEQCCGGGKLAGKCQVIRILWLQRSRRESSGGTEHKNISKCKSNLMSSPWHNLIKSAYERTPAQYDIGMKVVVISFTDWRYILFYDDIQPKNVNINVCCAYSRALWTKGTEFWRWEILQRSKMFDARASW